jgi:hypothetical protein
MVAWPPQTHELANDAKPRLTHWQRALAWVGIVGGALLVTAVIAVAILEGIRYQILTIATLLFGIILIADGVLQLREKAAFRNSRAWLRIRIAANLFFIGASLSNMWLTSSDPHMGTAGLALIAAFVLTMGMFFLVMLLSGASWRGETGPRRS